MLSEKFQEVMSLGAYNYEKEAFTRQKMRFVLNTNSSDGYMKWLRNMDHTMKSCHPDAHRILYDNTEALTRHWMPVGSPSNEQMSLLKLVAFLGTAVSSPPTWPPEHPRLSQGP